MPRPRESVSPKQLAAVRPVEEFERLKALRQELPSEPISAPQPEPIETTCTP
jgi:hypothetical protein